VKNIRVAICQNLPTKKVNDTIENVSKMIVEAASSGAELVLLIPTEN